MSKTPHTLALETQRDGAQCHFVLMARAKGDLASKNEVCFNIEVEASGFRQRKRSRGDKRLFAILATFLLLWGCGARARALQELDEKYAQLFSIGRHRRDQYREGKLSAVEVAEQEKEITTQLFPPRSGQRPVSEDFWAYRLKLAKQVDNGEIDYASAKDLMRQRVIELMTDAQPSIPYAQIRLYRLALEVGSALEQPRAISDYRIFILNQPGVNAASAGGGTFYITRGALDLPDRQLLALLAHEAAHDALNHVAKLQLLNTISVLAVAVINLKSPVAAQIADQVRVPIFRAFSRSEEAEADVEGVRLLNRLGYSTEEMVALFQGLLTRYGNTGGFFATHPLTTDRILTVRQLPEDLAWAGLRSTVRSKAARDWLGMETRDLTVEEAELRQLPSNRGAIIEVVVPDSPAAKASIIPGDIVLELNGMPVEGSQHLRDLVRQQPSGSEVSLKIYRALVGTEVRLSITTGLTQESE